MHQHEAYAFRQIRLRRHVDGRFENIKYKHTRRKFSTCVFMNLFTNKKKCVNFVRVKIFEIIFTCVFVFYNLETTIKVPTKSNLTKRIHFMST